MRQRKERKIAKINFLQFCNNQITAGLASLHSLLSQTNHGYNIEHVHHLSHPLNTAPNMCTTCRTPSTQHQTCAPPVALPQHSTKHVHHLSHPFNTAPNMCTTCHTLSPQHQTCAPPVTPPHHSITHLHTLSHPLTTTLSICTASPQHH